MFLVNAERQVQTPRLLMFFSFNLFPLTHQVSWLSPLVEGTHRLDFTDNRLETRL